VYFCLSLVLFSGVAVVAPLAHAVAILGTPLDFTSNVSFNAATNRFVYKYIFTDLANAATNNSLRATVNESSAHSTLHLHGEPLLSFLNDGGAFAYDRPGAIPGILPHNYDWTDLDIGALAATPISFEDVHGPTMATMRAEYAPTGAVGFLNVPVPTAGLFIDGLGGGGGGIDGGLGGVCVGTTLLGLNKCYTYMGSAVEEVAGGFQYKKFLKNTGVVPIGPEEVVAGVVGPPNLANHFEAVHPSHLLLDPDHEDFNLPDNDCAIVANKAGGAYQWLALGDGGACGAALPGSWDVGEVLTLGFFDTHGPAPTAWAGQVFGSIGEGGSDDPGAGQGPNPAGVPEPGTLTLLSLGTLGLLGYSRKQRNPKRYR